MMVQTRSNHESNRVEPCTKQDQFLRRTVSSHDSNMIKLSKMGRTESNHDSKRVESWVEQGRIMGQTGSYIE